MANSIGAATRNKIAQAVRLDVSLKRFGRCLDILLARFLSLSCLAMQSHIVAPVSLLSTGQNLEVGQSALRFRLFLRIGKVWQQFLGVGQ